MKTDKATGIMYRQWDCSDPKAVFLLVHGLGAHSGRWNFLSDFFIQNNISSYALELKGFGETKDLRGHIESFNVYANDICSLRSIVARENPGKKIYLIGESLGGLISFLTAVTGPGLFDGLVCISPAFKGRVKMSLKRYLKVLYALIFNSKNQFDISFDSGMCTRDTAYRKIMDNDVMEHRLATARFIREIVAAQLRGYNLRRKVKIPVLFLLSGDDRLTDPGASKVIFEGLRTKDKTLIEYPDMYHALSIDLGKEKVFHDILKWVRDRG